MDLFRSFDFTFFKVDKEEGVRLFPFTKGDREEDPFLY